MGRDEELLAAKAETAAKKGRPQGGRPPLDDRACFDAALWLVITGGGWRRLPKAFGSSVAVRRKLMRWTRGPHMDWLWHAYVLGLTDDQAQALACHVRPERRAPIWSWALPVLLRARFRPEALHYSEEQY